MATAAFRRHGAHFHSLSPWEKAGVRVSRIGRHSRGAFTLLELLIAMALTLLLVYALAEFYSFVGDTVRDGRATIEMGGDLRSAVMQLQDDLNSVTVRPSPPIEEGNGSGIFEIVEGRANDYDADADYNHDARIATTQADGSIRYDGYMLGDMDDMLVMTIRSSGSPFVGRRYNAVTGAHETIQSNLAEVIWFSTFKDLNSDGNWDADEPRFLVRRVLLIRPDLTALFTPTLGAGENFFHHNDISAHPTASGWVPNSLDDLTRRENRFIHINLLNLGNNGLRAANSYLPNPPVLQPFINDTTTPDPRSTAYYTLQRTQDPNTGLVGDFLGEDHILPNLLAFDVRVYDPLAPLLGDNQDVVGVGNDTNSTTDDAQGALQPGDPGYLTAIRAANQVAGYGAYVDLWYNRGLAAHPQGLVANNIPVTQWPNSAFSWAPDAHNLPSSFRATAAVTNPPFLDSNGNPMLCVWDSWSTYYNRDGYDQDGVNGADQGTNGIDDDGINGVDDPGESETHPPYPIWVGDNGIDDDLDGQIDELAGMPQVTDEGAVPQPNVQSLLRGIQVRIRLYEPGTRQTRQATVVADFVSE